MAKRITIAVSTLFFILFPFIYPAMSQKEECDVENLSLNDSPGMNPFTAQEVYCYA